MAQQLNATKLTNVLKEPSLYLNLNLWMDFNLMKITEESLKYFGLLLWAKFNFKPNKVVETDNENYALIVTCLNVTETQVGFQRYFKVGLRNVAKMKTSLSVMNIFQFFTETPNVLHQMNKMQRF